MMLSPAQWTPELISSEVARVVKMFAAEPGVRRVWFFGSGAQRKRLDYASDLDFAVEGLAAERYFAVLGRLLMEMHCPVDLVRWEEASDALRAQITRTGTVVYAG